MGSFKDVGRLFNGLSLVAKEILRRSEAFETAAANSGNLETLITSTLKKAVVSVTDLSGLTKGKVRHFSNPNSSSNRDSVVYFSPDPIPPETQQPDHQAAIVAQERGSDLESPITQTVAVNTTTAEDVFATPALLPNQSESQNVTADDAFPTPALPPNQSESRNVTADDAFATTALPPNQFESQNVPAEGNVEGKQAAAVTTAVPVKRRTPRERRVPSTPFSRALGFAGLGAGLAWGTVQESAKRLVFGTPDSQDKQSAISPFLSEKNAERLALALCRMRGAALKLGQMLSIQDESLVPAPILAALDIVRQGADVMPRSQLNQVLEAELGPNWSSKLISFDYEPLAAASIGQVHRAVMKDGLQVAMKIQYPGVADSIESDIENCKLLLDYTNLIPEGLYLDSAMKVAKEELSRECDYELEALNQKRFRDLLANMKGVYVPIVVDETSSKRVLTTELVSGITIDKVALLDQETRNYVGKTLLELTLMELFVFRFMQTDPNWGNFLYDETTTTINLIDFGAARDYPKSFVDDYLRMVLACANGDREAVIEMSRRLGFLTGMESEIMLDAHVQAGFVVGLPFSKTGGYDFRSTNITQSISNLGATMLRHRLTPPPDEAYSLHRKLSGAFLACIKLGAVVPCRELLLKVYEQYQFSEDGGEILSSSSVS